MNNYSNCAKDTTFGGIWNAKKIENHKQGYFIDMQKFNEVNKNTKITRKNDAKRFRAIYIIVKVT